MEKYQVSPENLKIIPSATEEWYCCNFPWPKYSNLIRHIENQHIPYRTRASDTALKYGCHLCRTNFETFQQTVQHFTNSHVDHQIYCQQCFVKYPGKSLETYYSHIVECNILEEEIQTVNRCKTRRQKAEAVAKYIQIRRSIKIVGNKEPQQ